MSYTTLDQAFQLGLYAGIIGGLIVWAGQIISKVLAFALGRVFKKKSETIRDLEAVLERLQRIEGKLDKIESGKADRIGKDSAQEPP